METGYLVLGIALMGLGVCLVIVGVFWEIGQYGTPWFYNLALVAVGFALILLGQWFVL